MRTALKILERTALPTPIHISETSFFLYAGNISHILSDYYMVPIKLQNYVKREKRNDRA